MPSWKAVAVLAMLLLVPLSCKSAPTEPDAVFTADMRADLSRLVGAEQAYKTANGSYTTSTAAMLAALAQWPSAGVTVTLIYATATSFGATATHTQTTRVCAVYFGTTPPVQLLIGVTLTSGQPACGT
jgi:hypothetical protein